MNRHIKRCFRGDELFPMSEVSFYARVVVASAATDHDTVTYASLGVGRSYASDQWISSHASDIVNMEHEPTH